MKLVSVYLFIALTALMLLFACEFKEKGKRNPIQVKLAPPAVPKPTTRYFTGIMGKDSVILRLVNLDGKVAGGYYYHSDSIEHKLSGNMGKDGITLYELDGTGGKIAIFKGRSESKGNIAGTKTKMDGSSNVNVTLTLTADSTIYRTK